LPKVSLQVQISQNLSHFVPIKIKRATVTESGKLLVDFID